MSIGETLARARHQAGLTIAEVSQRTRIRQRLIQGIEADDFSECGGDFYTRGHIRSIARAVGIDPEPLIGEYDRVWRAPDPLAGVRDLVTASRAALPDPGDRGEDPAEDPGPPPGGPGGPATGSGQPGGGHRQPGTMFRRPPMAPRRPRVNWTLALALALVVAVGLAGFRLLSGGGPAAPAAARSGSPAAGVPAAQGGGTPERQPAAAGSSAVPAASSPAPTAARGTRTPAPAGHTPGPPGPARPLRPAGVTAFGSGGSGDNAALAHLAIDASPATAWHTDWYTTATFGNLYRGTGLLLNMGRRVTITRARVVLGSAAGIRFQVRVGSAPDLAALRPAARAAGAGGSVTLRLHRPAHGRYVLIWFTRLAPDPAGTYQAAVHSITLTGRA